MELTFVVLLSSLAVQLVLDTYELMGLSTKKLQEFDIHRTYINILEYNISLRISSGVIILKYKSGMLKD